jgi:hypothetical protein
MVEKPPLRGEFSSAEAPPRLLPIWMLTDLTFTLIDPRKIAAVT